MRCGNGGGTASRWRHRRVPGMEMAGKTGTGSRFVLQSPRRKCASGVLKDTALPWQLRDHGLFIAFAPVAAPRYAARLHRRAWRARPSAGPDRAHDILKFAQTRDPLEALRTAYPANAAMAAPPKLCMRGHGMTTRALTPPRAARWALLTSCYEVNWGIVLLITIVACVGFSRCCIRPGRRRQLVALGDAADPALHRRLRHPGRWCRLHRHPRCG